MSSIRKVTMMDVARRCGVSKSAVNHAFNRPEALSAATVQEIHRVATELGYRPNFNARALARQRTGLVGIFYLPPTGAVPRGSYEPLTDEVDTRLSTLGYHAIFVRVSSDPKTWDEVLGDGRFDGLILLCTPPGPVIEQLLLSRFPIVVVNNPNDQLPGAQLSLDEVDGTEQVMRHLLSLGHKRITFYPGRKHNPHYSSEVRRMVYERMMRDAGLTPDTPFTGPVDEFVRRTLTSDYRATAILDYEHWTAVRVLQQLWREGVVVPRDISVATFNDAYPTNAVIPPLTTVGMPMQEMGARAVDLIIKQINEGVSVSDRIMFKPTLVVRESTGRPRDDSACQRA